MDVSVIIVSYNTARLLSECLASVLRSEGVSFEVAVVDNASRDESVRVVKEGFPGVRLIANTENRGFGAANNQALPGASGRYIILLNPDTTVGPDTFARMVRFMDGHPEVGLAGPRVENPDGTRQRSVSERYPGHRHGARDLGELPGKIACVLGACHIIRAELFKAIGGFDEDFFLYGEDEDLCLRVRRRGLEIGFMDDAVIMHHGGASERTAEPVEVLRKKIRAEHLFYGKHYTRESFRRILRSQARKALWRVLSVTLSSPFARDRAGALAKLSRYRLVLEENRAALSRLKN